ncbi:MAG: hypothetical protein WBA01_20040 [Phormidesmis sp.]
MKSTTTQNSCHILTQLANRLFLGRTFEGSYGAGIMTAGYKRATGKTGWSTRQLLAMSDAKSFYN